MPPPQYSYELDVADDDIEMEESNNDNNNKMIVDSELIDKQQNEMEIEEEVK